MGTAAGHQPLLQREQPGGGRGKRSHLVPRPARRRDPHTRHHGLLVHVEPRTPGMNHVHRRALQLCRRDVPWGGSLPSVLVDRGVRATIRGAHGTSGPTRYRASRTTQCSTSVPAPAPYQFPASRVDPEVGGNSLRKGGWLSDTTGRGSEARRANTPARASAPGRETASGGGGKTLSFAATRT